MANKAIWQQVTVDAAGNVITDATVEVRTESNNTLATLYTDRAGGDPLANPFTPGSDGYPVAGFAVFFTEPGVYKITVTSPTAGTRTLRYVVLLADATADQASDYLSASIASGDVEDFDASSALIGSIGVLDLNPSAGNTNLESIAWDAFADGQELVIRNVHASNLLTLKVSGDASTGYRGFSSAYDLALMQFVAVKVKKSVGADAWLILS